MAPKTVVPDASKGLANNSNLSNKDTAEVQKQLDDAIDSAFSGGRAQEKANQARQRAAEASSSSERDQYEREAADLERQAQKQLKTSQRLQSGAWQGFGAGAGMGAATGIGLGGAVGTVTGGVLAVPLTALGGLVGAGAGLAHGPWIKLTRGKDGPEIAAAEEGEPGAIELHPKEVKMVNAGIEKSVKGGRNVLGHAAAKKRKGPPIKNAPKPGRKPPKKLEKRGGDD
jgi:hypothetical protein